MLHQRGGADVAEGLRGQPDAVGDGDAGAAQQLAGGALVVGQPAGVAARADVGHRDQLQQRLDLAVLAELAVQRGQGDDHLVALQGVQQVAVEVVGVGLHARGAQLADEVAAAGQRDVALVAQAAGDHGDGSGDLTAVSPARSRSGRGRGSRRSRHETPTSRASQDSEAGLDELEGGRDRARELDDGRGADLGAVGGGHETETRGRKPTAVKVLSTPAASAFRWGSAAGSTNQPTSSACTQLENSSKPAGTPTPHVTVIAGSPQAAPRASAGATVREGCPPRESGRFPEQLGADALVGGVGSGESMVTAPGPPHAVRAAPSRTPRAHATTPRRPGGPGRRRRRGRSRPAQMWTTGQVSVRVMPSRVCTLATTSLPSSSTLRASARTMTS